VRTNEEPRRWEQLPEPVRTIAWILAYSLAFVGKIVTWSGRGVIAGGKIAARTVRILIRWPKATVFGAGLAVAVWNVFYVPFPASGDNELLDHIARNSPRIAAAVFVAGIAAPAVGAWLFGYVSISVWRVWGHSRRRGRHWGHLPGWPQSPRDASPSLVVGEVHHPVEPREIGLPSWLTIPEKGLYTGVAIFGAVGTGKTSACMYPFAEQLLSWQAKDRHRRAAALVLEVKGDFCHQVREILAAAGREEDYVEIGIGTGRSWNPLSATWLDPYSLAYTISSLLNQLFGKGKEPFWQQASTNLVRWIIQTHRAREGGWVTLRDVYRCAIDSDLLLKRIREAERYAQRKAGKRTISIPLEAALAHSDALDELGQWTEDLKTRRMWTSWRTDLPGALRGLNIEAKQEGPTRRTEDQEIVDAIHLWYEKDWMKLSKKLRSSIIEGVSVFLSMFDIPKIASAFCPEKPVEADQPAAVGEGVHTGQLPSLKTLIDRGSVLALNMPAGANPALGRAVGVMLKNAWLQALMLRPAKMKAEPKRYFRPAVFICDEYQQFATAGEDDPSGDEKSFALTRQSKCIPIVATQSVSSLRAVLGSSEAWRALLQTLRTRIFLSLSDDASTQLAASLSGEVERVKASWGLSETSRTAGVSPLTATVGSGQKDMGWTKNYNLSWQALFQPRDFARLENCQAICIPYDGKQALEATRVYLKPYYLPRDLGYWEARSRGKI